MCVCVCVCVCSYPEDSEAAAGFCRQNLEVLQMITVSERTRAGVGRICRLVKLQAASRERRLTGTPAGLKPEMCVVIERERARACVSCRQPRERGG